MATAPSGAQNVGGRLGAAFGPADDTEVPERSRVNRIGNKRRDARVAEGGALLRRYTA